VRKGRGCSADVTANEKLKNLDFCHTKKLKIGWRRAFSGIELISFGFGLDALKI
jgi:hypothetical protein